DDRPGLCEELGDLLFQIVFLARLAQEEGAFTAEDVVAGIARKMIRRHPHVFGDASVSDANEVLKNWEAIKAEEKREGATSRTGGVGAPSVIDGIPRSLPALLKAQRLGTKAARVGFDWEDAGRVIDKIDEELDELREAVPRGDREAVGEELGDLLFSVAMLARKLDVDPEGALERSNLKFSRRLRWIESRLAEEGRSIADASADEIERLWERAKRADDR
ncbi:MAG TPA: nucleoside triphosphate pyrophosphohydrolase, partial [Candidatus Polarisedimenticolaceae bacterium]|nr:nucleoside triphosphate pyrophosphohydrolase [Candidatus Polarisedimenticolaceae bacterium]